MGLSNITVSHQVEGEYTLVELLDLLGSSSKVKSTLKDLEAATKLATKAKQDLEKAEAQRDIDNTRAIEDSKARSVSLQAVADKATEAQRKLVNARSVKANNLKIHEQELDERQNVLMEFEAAAKVMKAELEKGLEDLAADRGVFDKTVAKAEKEIKKDMKAAEKYRQEALQIRREADDKVEAMQRVLS